MISALIVDGTPHNPPDGDTPYLLIVQGDYVEVWSSRVVVPLVEPGFPPLSGGGLMPEFSIEGRVVVMNTAQIAGIHVRDIGTVVAHLGDRLYDVRRAIDMLTGGF